MIEVFFTHYHKEFPSKLWDKYFQRMPKRIQDRISRLVRWQDKQSGLLGKILLLEGLRKHGFPPDYLKNLSYTEYNKPFLGNSIDFNISHSEEYVVCAMAVKGKVGIDIEKIRPIELFDFKDQMTFEQWKAIEQSPDQFEKFYELWTIKESVIKGDGRGLSVPLLDIHINNNIIILNNNKWYVRKIEISPYYYCHVATDIENIEIEITEFEIR